jgi:hypothetical protein
MGRLWVGGPSRETATPVRHFPGKEKAQRFATDPEYSSIDAVARSPGGFRPPKDPADRLRRDAILRRSPPALARHKALAAYP